MLRLGLGFSFSTKWFIWNYISNTTLSNTFNEMTKIVPISYKIYLLIYHNIRQHKDANIKNPEVCNYVHTKGQIISKCLFGVFNFHQKTNEKQVDLSFHSSKVKLFRLFFGGNVYLKKSFRLFLTFSMLHQKVCQPIVKTWIFSCTILNDDRQHYLHILLHSVSF